MREKCTYYLVSSNAKGKQEKGAFSNVSTIYLFSYRIYILKTEGSSPGRVGVSPLISFSWRLRWAENEWPLIVPRIPGQVGT